MPEAWMNSILDERNSFSIRFPNYSPKRSKSTSMAGKRVFIAFAVPDKKYRDFLVGHARNPKTPFDFIDMSAKEPWDSNWKTNCRTRVKGSDGVIALISANTASADGQLWEIQCAYEENIPTMLMWINDERPQLPAILKGKLINIWSWVNLEAFVGRL
jgi:antiphage defense system Thoeris ThsB-like protein